jgi:hypothetical protein
MEHRISLASLAGCTGRGVRVAVVDSGIHDGHPHVGAVSPGAGVHADGSLLEDVADRLGHGTAVAAAIREKAPHATLIPLKVFDLALATTGRALVSAIRWAASRADLINLSLGTANPAHRTALAEAVAEAGAAGALVVSVAPQDGIVWLPGALEGVVAVTLDWTCPRDECRVVAAPGRLALRASGLPRPIPGVPPEHNLRGPSFAVANATGLLALVLEGGGVRSIDELISRIGHRSRH